MEKTLFGTLPTGEKIYKYTIKSKSLCAVISTRGAAIVSLVKNGIDIVGGFDTLEDYLRDDSHQGAIIGRVANRVENAVLKIDGNEYLLTKNDGENCLHGGVGFDFKVWDVIEYKEDKITLSYTSPAMEEGFPASLGVTVSYTVSGNDLIIDYTAIPDGKTAISLTNHAYFNLDGFGGDIKAHSAVIYADKYTEVNENLIPTGKHPSVIGTPFDFTEEHEIGERIGDNFIGYDHNFVIKPERYDDFLGKSLALAAIVKGKRLKLSTYTDQPGIQLYIGNFLGNGPDFKGGIPQVRHGAFCIEAQTEPNSVNHGVGIYSQGEVYRQTTVYRVEGQNGD